LTVKQMDLIPPRKLHVQPIYKGHSKEHENVAFISICPLYTG